MSAGKFFDKMTKLLKHKYKGDYDDAARYQNLSYKKRQKSQKKKNRKNQLQKMR